MISAIDFIVPLLMLWQIISIHISPTATNKLCGRVFFNHGDETKMPYVQLEGIYRKYGDVNGYAIFKHEQRNYYFEYLDTNGENLMVFSVFVSSKRRRTYIGLKARMTNEFKSARWVDLITDPKHPFQRFIVRWEYYDWQSKKHVSIGPTDVRLTCVPADVFRCSSERVFFNTTFTDTSDGKILHNYLTDYFQELTGGYNDYRNYRKQFRHSRQSNWILYYERPYWKVKNDRSSYNRPFLRAKDSSFRPEYITAPWQHLDGSWRTFANPTGIRCRGFMQYDANGTTKSCFKSDPCLNAGVCVNSKLTKETICRCSESFTGLTCRQAQRRCSKYLYDPKSVQDVMIYGLESSNFASVFCKENYKPQYFLSQCVSERYSSKWSPKRMCSFSPRTTPRIHVRREKQEEPFNFDDYPVARPVLLTLVCLLQVLVPSIHMIVAAYKNKSCLRTVSMHAFISFICWLMYFFGCKIGNCQSHGKVLRDFIIMSVVMIPLSYIYMLIESYWSAEKQYVSSILMDVSVIDFVEKLKRTEPQRIMSIECYHWETRIRTVYYTDSNGNTQTRTETYQERVTTYTEQRVFPVGSTEDISDPEGLRFDLYGVTRLKLTPDVQCGDEETMTKFSEMQQQMIEDNKHRDDCIDFTYSDVIDGFQKRICAYSDPKYRPFWMNAGVFWVSSLFGLNWIFRIIFNWKTTKCEYTIKKLIYYTPRYTPSEGNGASVLGANNTAFHTSLHSISCFQGGTGISNAEAHVSSAVPNQIAIPMNSRAFPNEPPPAYADAMRNNTGI